MLNESDGGDVTPTRSEYKSHAEVAEADHAEQPSSSHRGSLCLTCPEDLGEETKNRLLAFSTDVIDPISDWQAVAERRLARGLQPVIESGRLSETAARGSAPGARMDRGTMGTAAAGAAGEVAQDEGQPSENLATMAEQTLSYLEQASAAAEAELAGGPGLTVQALASVNTLTSAAPRSLGVISSETRRNLEAVIAQPAIARVEVLNEAGERETFFITPGGAPRPRIGKARTASYRSPAGRLAAIPVGVEIEVRTPSGLRSYELVARERLRPELGVGGWDARDTVVERLLAVPLTVRSLRALLGETDADDDLALLERLLGEGAEENVIEGLRRTVVERMGLRHQPLLDQYQDEIFRLGLDRQLAILGPPGSGKTTTLVKRLGLKLDLGALGEELAIVDGTFAGRDGHHASWLMFSPTELLRLYVKEALSRERIPATDREVQVWDQYRLVTARNQLRILRGQGGGGAVLRRGAENLLPSAIADAVGWFEDFERWQHQAFWSELAEHVRRVGASADARLARLADRLSAIVTSGARAQAAAPFAELRALSRELGDRAGEQSNEVVALLRGDFATQLRSDGKLLDKLNEFVSTLGDASDGSEEVDETDAEEEEDEPAAPRTRGREAAFNAYLRAMRAHARALAMGRRLGPSSRHRQTVEWLGPRVPNDDVLRRVGEAVLMGSSLRRLANPLRGYMRGMMGRYRRFRRTRQAEVTWYGRSGFGPSEIGPLELDLVMLGTLRAGRMLLGDRTIAAAVEEPALDSLRAVRDLFRTQVMVDEATDFSPVQLACMAALCDPAADSFLACGDFNQRITAWGSRGAADLRWACPGMDVRTVKITYRHSRQLNALAHGLAGLAPDAPEATLPEHVDNEGVDPVLGLGLSGAVLVSWLAERIVEIERLTSVLPSIAVLVNREDEVQPLADALDAALSGHNVRCVPCHGGQVRGNDNDVRVFDVQHIKGLEFEAVFFVGVDELAGAKPTLFDKFLYVGATRAAMYLGLTASSVELPPRLLPLSAAFGPHWRQV